jgi:hypothetical protein
MDSFYPSLLFHHVFVFSHICFLSIALCRTALRRSAAITNFVLCFLRPVNFGIFATVAGLIYPKDAFGLFTECKLADAL